MEYECQGCGKTQKKIANMNNDPNSSFFYWHYDTDDMIQKLTNKSFQEDMSSKPYTKSGLEIYGLFCFECGTTNLCAAKLGFFKIKMEYFGNYKYEGFLSEWLNRKKDIPQNIRDRLKKEKYYER